MFFFFFWLNANFAKVFQLLLVSCKSYSRSLKLYYNLLLYCVKEVQENEFVDIFWQAVLVKGSMLLNFSWNLRAIKQSFTKYLRQILALMWNSILCKGFNFCFSGYFYWRWQDFYLGSRTKPIILWSFEIFLIITISLRSWVLSCSATHEATRINQFITNNHASSHLWRKENLFNHQKISKYYEANWRWFKR